MKNSILIAIIGIFIAIIAIAFTYSNNGKGIHPISSNAVYIAGSSCTINMTLDRIDEEIRSDMIECLRLHQQYK